MKHSRLHLRIPISFAILGILLILRGVTITSPAQNSRTRVSVKRTAAVSSKKSGGVSKDSSQASVLRLAASNNALLGTNLNWTFGGKEQRGWYLYKPLINRFLKTENDSTSPEFAKTVSKWQEKMGLKPSGVVDEETLYRMISEWQEKRLKDRTLATRDKLLTAPPSDFYHPVRPEELRLVERNTYRAYRRMIRAAAADRSLGLRRDAKGNLDDSEKYLKIISAFRSPEYQEQLRKQSPNSGRAGLAINSPHFTGRALDLYVGGEPVETKDSNRAIQVQTKVYLWLVRHAESFGFRPYFYEPWHWEYLRED